MIDDPDDLAAMLDGPLSGREVVSLDLPGTSRPVLAAVGDPGDVMGDWRAARALVPRTFRWPVVVEGRITGATTAEDFILDLPWRPISQILLDTHASPADADRAGALFDVPGAAVSLDRRVGWHLDRTRERCGTAPTPAELAAGLGLADPEAANEDDAERWLLAWEERHVPTVEPETGRWNEWHEIGPEPGCVLLFMPPDDGPRVLAYLGFWAEEGIAGMSAARLIRILDHWSSRYGAELVAHWGTMLQFSVAEPPGTLEEALALAAEHHAVAPCTTILPGMTRRDHARVLWKRTRWFLHERP